MPDAGKVCIHECRSVSEGCGYRLSAQQAEQANRDVETMTKSLFAAEKPQHVSNPALYLRKRRVLSRKPVLEPLAPLRKEPCKIR